MNQTQTIWAHFNQPLEEHTYFYVWLSAEIHASFWSSHIFITRAGEPTAIHRSGRLLVTTLLAPTMVIRPIVTPGQMTTF